MNKTIRYLKYSEIDTPLGSMLSIADEEKLYLLEFTNLKNLDSEVKQLEQKTKSVIQSGTTEIHSSIENELNLYFKGKLKIFKTPLFSFGTPFQANVWSALQKIPYGKTQSYSTLAMNIGNSSARRAVGRANGANQIAIVIPCHRVINANGDLGGYAGGVERKEWLLKHEGFYN